MQAWPLNCTFRSRRSESTFYSPVATKTRQKKAVLIELKQWSKANATTKDAIVKTALGGGLIETIHPSYQVWSYAALLEGFNEAVYDKSIEIRPCAYLHNYVSDGVIDSAHYEPHISKAPLFLKGPEELSKLRTFLKKHISHGDNKEVLYELSEGKTRPSKALAEASGVDERQTRVRID